jgi:hypothetical protein
MCDALLFQIIVHRKLDVENNATSLQVNHERKAKRVIAK